MLPNFENIDQTCGWWLSTGDQHVLTNTAVDLDHSVSTPLTPYSRKTYGQVVDDFAGAMEKLQAKDQLLQQREAELTQLQQHLAAHGHPVSLPTPMVQSYASTGPEDPSFPSKGVLFTADTASSVHAHPLSQTDVTSGAGPPTQAHLALEDGNPPPSTRRHSASNAGLPSFTGNISQPLDSCPNMLCSLLSPSQPLAVQQRCKMMLSLH